jgi:hypothetical protein
VYDPTAQDRKLGVSQKLLKPLIHNPKIQTLPKDQTRISNDNITLLSHGQRHQLDQLAALAVYGDGRPFILYESPYMKAFLKKLNPAYVPPSRNRLDSTLLQETYNSTKEEVDRHLEEAKMINIIFDETTNISGKRVINLIAYTERGPFFYKHILIPKGQKASSDNFVKYLLPVIEEVCRSDFSKINSFSTDTCATMRKWWRTAKRIPQLSHCLFIACDSHGIQLAVKDILELPDFKETIQLASKLVKSFHASGKRLDLLHEHQIKVAGKTSSLTASIITRWGTQYRMLSSLKNSEQPLRNYVDDENYEMLASEKKAKKPWVRPTIKNSDFFNTITTILRIIQPFHEAQIMSESNASNIMLVRTRWQTLESHLISLRESLQEEGIDFEAVFKKFQLRRHKQLQDHHLLAYYLFPANARALLPDSERDLVFGALKSMTTTNDDFLKAKAELYNYRAQREVYSSGRSCWDYRSTPLTFWDDCDSEGAILPQIARRLAQTIANSVPSERAFSTMNLIHSKSRNRLSPAKVEQQVYIHVNRRILDHPHRKLFQLTEDDLLKYEVLAGGMKESGIHLREGQDDARELSDSDSNSDSNTEASEDSELDEATATSQIATATSQATNSSLKRKASMTLESQHQPYFHPQYRPQTQPYFDTRNRAIGLQQYGTQGHFQVQTAYKEQIAAPGQAHKQIEVPNRPYSTHIDRDHFRPTQMQPALQPLLPRPAADQE